MVYTFWLFATATVCRLFMFATFDCNVAMIKIAAAMLVAMRMENIPSLIVKPKIVSANSAK